MNNKKGFVTPLVIAIVCILAIAGGVYMFSQNKNDDTANWKTYTHAPAGFNFAYPETWNLEEDLGPNRNVGFNLFSSADHFQGDNLKEGVMKAQFQLHTDKAITSEQQYIDTLLAHPEETSFTNEKADIVKMQSTTGSNMLRLTKAVGDVDYVVPLKPDFSQVLYVIVWNVDPQFEKVITGLKVTTPTFEITGICTLCQPTSTPAPIKIGKVAVDLADAKVVQAAVDAGHQPWRLNPNFVAQSVVGLDGSSRAVHVSIDSQTKSSIYFVVSNGKRYEVTVTQPVAGQNKIFVVSDIEYAPTTSAQNTTTQTKIYTDPKNRFSITYPKTLTLETSNVTGDDVGRQEHSDSALAEKLLQVSLGKGLLIETLTISVSPDPKDVAKCMTAPDYYVGYGPSGVSPVKINGVSFLAYTAGDIGTGSYSNNQVYRTIHNNACWTITEATNRTSENRLTKEEALAQKNTLEAEAAELDPIVQSFTFIK